jgi:Trypsin
MLPGYKCLGLHHGPQPRIIGGQNAPKGRFPWFVRTYGGVQDSTGAVTGCGGSLIAPDIVLTAAHCETPAFVEVSAYNLEQRDKSLQRKVVANTRHPEYPQKLQIDYDVMILKLETPFTEVEPIQLNVDDSTPSRSGEELKMLGFGSTVSGSNAPVVTSNILQIASTNYVPFEECAVASDPESGFRNGVSTTDTVVKPWWLCTLKTQPDVTATCYGDSGGPVIREGQNAVSDLLVGVISGGSTYCGNPYLPLWNNRVSYHHDWITSVGCGMSVDAPASWNCKGRGGGGGGGGNDGGGNLGIAIGVILILLLVVGGVGIFIWRRRSKNSKPNKKPTFDEENPTPFLRYDRDGSSKKNSASAPFTTLPPSPGSSEASRKQEPPPHRRFSDSEAKSPLARRPSGLFNRRPSMDPAGNDKSPGSFGRKLSMDANKEKNVSEQLGKDDKFSLFGRKPSMEPSDTEKAPGWLGRLPSLTPGNDSKVTDESFVPKDIADMVDQLDKELDGVFEGDLNAPSSKHTRERSKSSDRSRPASIRDCSKSRSHSVDRQGSNDFAARRGRGSSRDGSAPSRGRSMDRARQSSHDRQNGPQKDPPAPSRGRNASQSERTRSKSRDPSDNGRSRSRSADPRRPKSFSALSGHTASRPSRNGPQKNPPPRSRSDIVNPASVKLPDRPKRGEPTRAPPPRTKSDTAALFSSRQKEIPANNALSRRQSDILSPNPRHGSSTREDAMPRRNPPPRTKSDIVTSSSARQRPPKRETSRHASPTRTPPARTSSLVYQSKYTDAPAGSMTKRSPPRTRSDVGSSEANGTRPGAADSSFKGVFDKWKERESSTPEVTKNSDGTVTVAKSRYNAEGMKVITKTKYASVELARRHGVDV